MALGKDVCPHCRALAQALTPFVLAAKFYGPEWHDDNDLAAVQRREARNV